MVKSTSQFWTSNSIQKVYFICIYEPMKPQKIMKTGKENLHIIYIYSLNVTNFKQREDVSFKPRANKCSSWFSSCINWSTFLTEVKRDLTSNTNNYLHNHTFWVWVEKKRSIIRCTQWSIFPQIAVFLLRAKGFILHRWKQLCTIALPNQQID